MTSKRQKGFFIVFFTLIKSQIKGVVEMENTVSRNLNGNKSKVSFWKTFSVAAVFFSSHAGGGFATGNQANVYFVGSGWAGILASILSMLLLSLVYREAMIMYRDRNLKNYKHLFQALFHPFDKLSILFDIFFNIMVLMVVATSISSAATAFKNYFDFNYYLAVIVLALLTLMLTMWGADLVRKVGTVMGLGIMFTALAIYLVGIFKGTSFSETFSQDLATNGMSNLPAAAWNGLIYAGFQCVHLPTMLAVSVSLSNRKEVSRSMQFSFIVNALGLGLSTTMLYTWQSYYTSLEGGSSLPTLVSLEAMHMPILLTIYAVSLLLCLVSSAVTITFGFVGRFENTNLLKNVKSLTTKRAIISGSIIVISMLISMLGLDKIIKYGYGLNGYLAIAVVIIPLLTLGVYKNRQFRNEKTSQDLSPVNVSLKKLKQTQEF